MAAHGQEVEDSVKDMLRDWRSKRPEVMAEIYVGAMKVRPASPPSRMLIC